MPVSEVTSDHVLESLTPIWHRKPETARRVRLRLRAVLERAAATESGIDNPCDRIGPVLYSTGCCGGTTLPSRRSGRVLEE